MVDISTIISKNSNTTGSEPGLGDLVLGELAVNTYDGNIFLKQNKSGAEEILKFVSHAPVENTLYVQKAGSDSNDGTSFDRAFATIEAAVTAATTRAELTVIHIGPGTYYTQGHIDMPDDCIIHSDYRACVIKPEAGYEQRNVFRMGSGCFLQGPVFEGFQIDDIDNPTEGFAVAFRPGAVIRRTPYAHKIAVRSTFPFYVAPPLDRENANPFVTRGGGVCLADGAVISPYSVYPNFMTWGATPTTQNGMGYVAKNGALINAVNAISIWAHKHFTALSGGQIILSSCSTQFGDYTLVADGSRNRVDPEKLGYTVPRDSTAGVAIMDSDFLAGLKDDVWNYLDSEGYTTGWTEADELYTRRDTGTLVQSISWVLRTQNEQPWIDTIEGFFDRVGLTIIDSDKTNAYIASWDFIDSALGTETGAGADSDIHQMFTTLKNTINSPTLIKEPSTITAIGHTFNSTMAGVALTQIPPAANKTTIEESILELDGGVVIASGQDDEGTALFIGGMKIDADTGELSGPPFESAVRRIATRTALSTNF